MAMTSHPAPSGLRFLSGFFAELALLVLAVIWGRLFDLRLFSNQILGERSILIGTVAAVPPFLFFVWAIRSEAKVLAAHQRLLERLVRPLFRQWSLGQLALISIAAGVSEEALFRGAIQGSLTKPLGAEAALVIASLLFGAAHLITWTYAIVAALIGIYLGLIWIWTGTLFAPMITHAVYDFLALVYLLRVHRSDNPL